MLSPRYDLPIARRGVISLSPNDVNAIFTYEESDQFERMLKAWEGKMTAPAFGRTGPGASDADMAPPQLGFFE